MKRIELCLDRQVSRNLDRILDVLIEERIEQGGSEANEGDRFEAALVAESAGDRRLLEFFQHQRRSLARTAERFRAQGSVRSFRKATLLELEKWLLGREATHRVETETELYLSGAIVLMRSHEPVRRFLPGAGRRLHSLRETGSGEARGIVDQSLSSLDSGDFDRAFVEARSLIRRASQSRVLHGSVSDTMAWWEWFRGDVRRVEALLRDALKHAANHERKSSALNNLALYMNESGQFREAESLALAAMDLGESKPVAAINLAVWASLNGRVHTGRRAMRKLAGSAAQSFLQEWPVDQMFRVVDANVDRRGLGQSCSQSLKDDLCTFVYGDMESRG